MRSLDRLHGEVSLVPPISWQTITFAAAISLAACFGYLSLGRYAQTTIVTGKLESDHGSSRVQPLRAGVVQRVLVAEGARVQRGQPLVIIAQQAGSAGGALASRRAEAIQAQDQVLAERIPTEERAAQARISSLRAEVAAADASIVSLEEQRLQQDGLIAAAREDLQKIREIAQRGFISQQDVRRREEALATRKQDLSRLEQSIAEKRAAIIQARAEISRARADLGGEVNQVAEARARVAGTAASEENVSTYTILAGADGIATGIDANPGDVVSLGDILLSIVPARDHLHARLEIPAAAAGQVEQGQALNVAVDAYPYQTFGTLPAQISTMSRVAVPVRHADGTATDVFLVRAPLNDTRIYAYGRKQELRPGMTVTARITLRSQSLLQWLLSPLYAVAKR